MMQRLLEGELRTESMTLSAPSARDITQASNFSLCRRSAALSVTCTASILNWRNDSAISARYGSLNPTKAARAAAFRVMKGRGARVVAKALSIIGEDSTFESHCGWHWHGWQRTEGTIWDSVLCEKGHYAPKGPWIKAFTKVRLLLGRMVLTPGYDF